MVSAGRRKSFFRQNVPFTTIVGPKRVIIYVLTFGTVYNWTSRPRFRIIVSNAHGRIDQKIELDVRETCNRSCSLPVKRENNEKNRRPRLKNTTGIRTFAFALINK